MLFTVNLNFRTASLLSLHNVVTHSFRRTYEEDGALFFRWDDEVGLQLTRGTPFFLLVGSDAARYDFIKNLWQQLGASKLALASWRLDGRMLDNAFLFMLNPDAVFEGMLGHMLDLRFDCQATSSQKTIPQAFTLWGSTSHRSSTEPTWN